MVDPEQEPERPTAWRRALYRTGLGRLPEHHHPWLLWDLGQPGVRGRFLWSGVAAYGVLVALFVVTLRLPMAVVGWWALVVVGSLVVMTRPGPWQSTRRSLLLRNRVMTVDQMIGLRQGPGRWISGRWYCDAHRAAFCRDCAPGR